MKNPQISKTALFFTVLALFACDDEEQRGLRTKIDYTTLSSATPYAEAFVDANGASTVDLSEGTDRLKMFQALNYHITSSVAASTPIVAEKLLDLFSNTGDPFYDISTPSVEVSGGALNASPVQLRNTVASSLSVDLAEAVRTAFEDHFSALETASQSLSTTASAGQAGKLGNYLVDDKGIELAQIIQKSLIGALQLDYIGNVLMDEGLNADNFQAVGDKNYTQLEHYWDEAYGLLTLNPIYLEGATDAVRNTNEFGLGSYLWEYNKVNYSKIYPAFLKGRAAIVNNDRSQLQAQATFIRTEMERTIAAAALGYLEKWKTGATDAARAHAIGEALGFIYSLRFAQLHEADAAFSDGVWAGLVNSPNGFWDLDATKINSASDAIKAKFNL